MNSHFVVTLSLLLSSLMETVRLSNACSNLDALSVPLSMATVRVTTDDNVDFVDMTSIKVGIGVGELDGISEGRREGFKVNVGRKDGIMIGVEEGDSDKIGVGFAEGKPVTDGEADGVFDKDALGFAVGHRLSTP